jgi:multisubunit Na+/H+ antiporter MnhB subunit
MLRGVLSGLVVAAVTGVLFALVMYFCPVSWNLGDDAWNLLVLVGIMLSGSGFFAEFLGSRLNRGLRERARNRRAQSALR